MNKKEEKEYKHIRSQIRFDRDGKIRIDPIGTPVGKTSKYGYDKQELEQLLIHLKFSLSKGYFPENARANTLELCTNLEKILNVMQYVLRRQNE